ncbi:MAG: hypothetical protein ACO3FN_06050 [Vulcanococcus sp.]
MANTIRIKRSTGSSAPTSLANAEVAFAEGSQVLYYGTGTGGAGGSATSIIAIGGSGAYATLSTAQTISGNKTFTGNVDLTGAVATATTQSSSDNSTKVATTAFVQAAITGFGAGTVSSVGLSLPSIFTVSGSPVTTSGTLTGTLATQTANYVWAGPTTGADAAPAFRALVAGDIPDLSSSYLPISGGTVTSNLTISGDLVVNGSTTTINSTTLSVDDKNIVLGDVASPTDTTADGGGISLLGATTKTFNWINATDSWTSSEDIDLASGKVYRVNGTTVLSGSGLGTGVTSSSLTSVGTLTSGTWNATTIGVAYGGTGVTTLTGLVKGNGTSAFSAAVAGTDYLSPSSEIDGGSYLWIFGLTSMVLSALLGAGSMSC